MGSKWSGCEQPAAPCRHLWQNMTLNVKMFPHHFLKSDFLKFKNRKLFCSSFAPRPERTNRINQEGGNNSATLGGTKWSVSLKSFHKGLCSLPSSAAALFDSCATVAQQRCDSFTFNVVEAGEAVSEMWWKLLHFIMTWAENNNNKKGLFLFQRPVKGILHWKSLLWLSYTHHL